VGLVHSMRTAFTLMTALPLGGSRNDSLSADVAAFFPWVGWLLGAVLLLLLEALRSASLLWGTGTVLTDAAYLLGALIVLLLGLATRFLHWDGLADTADAIWNPGDVAHKLEIMADSSTGAFGATAIVLAALIQVTAYGTILESGGAWGWVILVAPVISRSAATFAAWLGTPARPRGLGDSIMGRPSALAAVAWLTGVLCAQYVMWLSLGVWGLVWSVGALVLAAVTPHLVASRIGGVTGDVMGASIVITQSLILAFAAVGSAI